MMNHRIKLTVVCVIASHAWACGDRLVRNPGEVSDPVDAAVIEIDAAELPDAPPPDAPPPDAPPPDAPGFDCTNNQPALPVAFNTYTGFSGAEDFAFDDLGNLVSVDSFGNLTRQPKSGPSSIFAPNVAIAAGTRFLNNGDIVGNGSSSIIRVKPSGAQQTVLSGFQYPNGLEVGLNGYIYVADQSAGTVREVHPDTGQFTVIASGLQSPNGVSFGPDQDVLYVGSFGAGIVYSIPHDDVTGWGPAEIFVTMPSGVGTGLDGVAVDVCGYVYITVFVDGTVWRFSPDGGPGELVVTLPSSWIPNLHWGTGIGGWDEDKLYVIERGSNSAVYELLLGVPEKQRVFP